MTWDQIREMSSHHINFGAHTVSHPNLSHSDPAKAEREFSVCKKEIEERLGKPVFGLAFPYGIDYHVYAELVDIVKRTGFLYSLTAVAGYNDHTTNPYLLRRIHLPITSSPALLGREVLLDFQIDNDAALARVSSGV
jgi:peptidoglycan/xylan/chitin deacetylase (PgdA/CDA1 family)